MSIQMHEKYMKLALEEATKGRGQVGLNPLVGAVIVKDGRIISTGYHEKYGAPHAEENAIRKAQEDVRGATVYVNLEPCSHFGKRPPCSKMLIEHGLAQVVIGNLDPNPKVSGRGIRELEAAGIEVVTDCLAEECHELNEVFFHHIVEKKPFVLLKAAMTLDGKIATQTGDSRWVSSEKSRVMVHQLRSNLDGIMVGLNTISADDPSLNVRHVEGRDPVRIVVDSKLAIGLDAKVLTLDSAAKTIIATTSAAPQEKLKTLSEMPNVQVMVCTSREGHVDLNDLMEKLYREGIGSLLLEGGAGLNYHMLQAGHVQKIILFIAPKIVGGEVAPTIVGGEGIRLMQDALNLDIKSFYQLDKDLVVEAKPCSQE